MSTLEQSVSHVHDGMTIGIAEFSYQNPPLALVRELVKLNRQNLTLVSGPTSGIATDILIGAGMVSKVVSACVSFEGLTGIAPNFRAACERGSLAVWECDECIWHVALKAGTHDQPYTLWQGGCGSDIPWLNPFIKYMIITEDGSEIPVDNQLLLGQLQEQGTTGTHYLKIPAIRLDTCFVHGWRADERGYVQYPHERYLGRVFNEKVMAAATDGEVIASVEELVSSDQIDSSPELTEFRASTIVECPEGAAPGACNGVYGPNLKLYKDYINQAKDWNSKDQIDRRAAILRWLNKNTH